MSLPYLPGWGDTLAQSGQQIGNNIAHIINPNVDFQKMFHAAIAQNPQLLQQIANSPGLAQSLGNSGLGDVNGMTSGMQVDPMVAAQRALLQSQANVAQGTEGASINTANANAGTAQSQQRVAEATEAPTIATANSNAETAKGAAKLTNTKADEAQRSFDLASQTLSAMPTLAGINLQDVGNAIARGDKNIPAQLLSRIGMDEGSQKALQLFVQSAISRADNAAQLTVAEIRKKDPSFQVTALSGLDKMIDNLTNQIKAANNTLNATKPKDLLILRSQAASKDADISGPAKQTLAQYDEALKYVNDHTPGSLNGQLAEAQGKYKIILNNLIGLQGNAGGVGNTQGGETSIKVRGPADQVSDIVTQLKDAIKTDPDGEAKAKGKVAKLRQQGKITEEQYNDIMGIKGKKTTMNSILDDTMKVPEKPKPIPFKIPGIVTDRK